MNQTFPFPLGVIHIIGIGGIGMSGYAELLHNSGYLVQGSDMAENANVQRLQKLGIRVMIGHDPQNIFDADGKLCEVVVKSTAVKEDNAEIISAKENDVPIIARVDLLAELMRNKWCVNISGTHGKTTTTSIIGHVMDKCGLDPTVLNGGIINAYGSNTKKGNSKWMVVEADESDGTFAYLPSVASIITNIDPEHLDYYGDFDTLKETFIEYTQNLPFYGVVIACIDHPVVAEILPEFHRHTITYGFSDNADIQAVNMRSTPEGLTYDVKINNQPEPRLPELIKDVHLPMFGKHNVLNSLTVFALGWQMKLNADDIIQALADFSGVKRRFTITGIVNDITIVDDYAHHPVEISSVLKAGQDALSGRDGKIIAVVQPHRYSRLKNLFTEFCECFDMADEIVVADVYAAGEKPLDGFNQATLAEGIKAATGKPVHALPTENELPALIDRIANPGDFVICLGAGNITKWAGNLPQDLQNLQTKTA